MRAARIARLTLLSLCSFLILSAKAGDAVAIAYNSAGVWTAVTYYCSSSPSGGADYKDAAGARAAALKDLKKRAGEGLAREGIVASSDKTGHFAYARGKTQAGEDEHVVGYGASAAEAQQDALEQLARRDATVGPKVIYNYFSHGSESPGKGGTRGS